MQRRPGANQPERDEIASGTCIEQAFCADIEKFGDVARQLIQPRHTLLRTPVSRDRVTARIEGDEYFRLCLNVMPAAMRKQNPAMRSRVEKETVLYQQRALPHDMVDQPLALALFGRAHR